MRLTRLTLTRFRGFDRADIEPAPGLNLFTGGNGAGKTSLLEAAHLLAYGRSFRGRVRDGLIRGGAQSLEVFAEWREEGAGSPAADTPPSGGGRLRRAGLRHSGRDWEARLDGAPATTLTELCAALALVSFEPGSHALIAGGAEERRRFLDWALFHVEPGFIPVWRRYARAHRQRNALLKSRPPVAALEPWDRELAEAGAPLTRLRGLYLERLAPVFAAVAGELLPELGAPRLDFQPGWRRESLSLADALLLARARDLVLGHGTVGPHRADWQVGFAALPGPEALSRGQEKLTALACVLAQARAFAADRGEWPVICLDDLASELDAAHQAQVLNSLAATGAQILLTGTEAPAALEAAGLRAYRFHVEPGRVRADPGRAAGRL